VHSSLSPALRVPYSARLRGRGGRRELREERHGGVAHGETLHTLGLGSGGEVGPNGVDRKWWMVI